jgi:hypothetical protein
VLVDVAECADLGGGEQAASVLAQIRGDARSAQGGPRGAAEEEAFKAPIRAKCGRKGSAKAAKRPKIPFAPIARPWRPPR